MNKTDNSPFPSKTVFVGGVLSALAVPILIVLILNVRYGNASSIAQAIQIYFLIFANLILINLHIYISKLLYAKTDKKPELIFSTVFVLITIFAMNWIFVDNYYSHKTSSTDALILFIIPAYGSAAILAGYLVGSVFKRFKNK